jgi:ATP-dependent helicase/nuclease subunit A
MIFVEEKTHLKEEHITQNPLLNFEQLEASNPDNSVWVSASAGTGKTKILTDRVLRLLINGVKPEKILCITFTKAAAGEMNNRINKELSIWANLSSIKLEERLKTSFGHPPTKEQLTSASHLFHEKLSSVENLKIQTIHSFCQFILGRFPVEAGLSPGFKVIDEYKTEELLKTIRINLIMQACENPRSTLSESLEFIASHIHENTLFDVIKDVIDDRSKFKELFNKFTDAKEYEADLRENFSLKKFEYEQDILEKIFAKVNILDLQYDIQEFDPQLFGKEISILKRYQEFCYLNKHEQNAQYEDFFAIFLTHIGESRKNLFNKKFRTQYPEIDELFDQIKQIIIEAHEQIKSLKLTFFSTHLFTLAKFIISTYEEYKFHHAYLDFDDLIYHTRKLLINSDAKDWVLYKLDGFVEHILVDEAQDTNAEQWQIIEALAKEFYSGATAAETNRTLFVVGDEKQSIYSFQGADPNSFIAMNGYFKDRIQAADKKFSNIDLSWSYRSLEAINIAVAKVFHKLQETNTQLFSGQNLNMKCFRQGGGGRIEVWPLVHSQKQDLDVTWPLPDKYEDFDTANILLAKTIAQYINLQINSKKYILSQKRTINASDFIILVKQRDAFSQYVIQELSRLNVKVAGIDRMKLTDSLAIKDLICLAKFVLLPQDDLNLACLLKSPFIGISETLLYEIAVERNKKSLWETLNILKNTQRNILEVVDILGKFIDIYNHHLLTEFFTLILEALGYREKLLIACGIDTGEIINEFLDLVANFERDNASNLQAFILWIESSNVEIKRDLEYGESVRVMTVHGSKGLQAPVVILADTTRLGNMRQKILWTKETKLLWPGYAANENVQYKELQDSYKQKDYLEYLRLLYVAMTRAEDELIIFGSSEREEVSENCWYQIIKEALSDVMLKSPLPGELLPYFTKQKEFFYLDMYGNRKIPIESFKSSKEQKYIPLIDITPKYSPSIIESIALSVSPLQSRYATEYGTVIHKLLEIFFTSKDGNKVVNHPLLEHLPQNQAAGAAKKIQQVTDLPEIRELFRYDLKCEVTVGVKSHENALLGRIDLLAVNDKEVIIIDYKTDTKVPVSTYEVPFEYKEQLKHYKKIMSHIYKDKILRTQIFWFENLQFMELKEQDL